MALDQGTRDDITGIIGSDDVVLFMKGKRRLPQCGFSATVVGILDQLVDKYTTVDVLSQPEIRQGIKEFSNWPTIPQLYVKGEFVGGCDIVKDLFAQGELETMLGMSAEIPAPTLTISEGALGALESAREADEPKILRFEIAAGFRYGLAFDEKRDGDVEITIGDYAVVLDRMTARQADGTTIDFVESAGGGGFKITNPNEPPRVKKMVAADLKAKLDAKEALTLVDVRTTDEVAIANITAARHFDPEMQAELLAMSKDATIVFHCHHGGRSQNVAEHFVAQGFQNIYNLEGGIDAWAVQVDSSIARY